MGDAVMKKGVDEQRQLSAERCCFQNLKNSAASSRVFCGFSQCLRNFSFLTKCESVVS